MENINKTNEEPRAEFLYSDPLTPVILRIHADILDQAGWPEQARESRINAVNADRYKISIEHRDSMLLTIANDIRKKLQKPEILQDLAEAVGGHRNTFGTVNYHFTNHDTMHTTEQDTGVDIQDTDTMPFTEAIDEIGGSYDEPVRIEITLPWCLANDTLANGIVIQSMKKTDKEN